VSCSHSHLSIWKYASSPLLCWNLITFYYVQKWLNTYTRSSQKLYFHFYTLLKINKLQREEPFFNSSDSQEILCPLRYPKFITTFTGACHCPNWIQSTYVYPVSLSSILILWDLRFHSDDSCLVLLGYNTI